MVGIAGIGRGCGYDTDIHHQFLADAAALPDHRFMLFYWQFNGQGRMGIGEIFPGSRIAQTMSVKTRGGCTCL